MSEFDLLQEAGADDLVAGLGDAEAVELDTASGKQRFAAIVGKLRTERVLASFGTTEHTEMVDRCRVRILDAPTLAPDLPVLVFAYASGDASVQAGQRFTIENIESLSGRWTTLSLIRPMLAAVEARGTRLRG